MNSTPSVSFNISILKYVLLIDKQYGRVKAIFYYQLLD